MRVRLVAEDPVDDGWPITATGEMTYEDAVLIGRHYGHVRIDAVNEVHIERLMRKMTEKSN